MRRSSPRIRWGTTDAPVPATLNRALVAPLAPVGHPAALPLVEGPATAVEELRTLLCLAAEVEHALMVQYLYAGVSLDSSRSSQTADAKSRVRMVAIQEMGHFVTIQNLLLALGGPAELHIGRDGLRAENTDNPLHFSLEPVSKHSIGEYVLAEQPAEIPDPQVRQRVDTILAFLNGKGNELPKRVGVMYSRIHSLLELLAPEDFQGQASIGNFEATPSEWNASSGPDMRIHSITDVTTAKAAIASISQQGEGLGHEHNSHFYAFLDTYALLEAGNVWSTELARTPYVRGAPPLGAISPTPLTNDYNRLWARLFNVRYTLLLLCIGHGLATPRSDADRATLIGWSFAGMTRDMMGLSSLLAAPAMAEREAHKRCGPPFELLYEDLPESALARWRRHAILLGNERDLMVSLRQRPELNDDNNGQFMLEDLEPDNAARTQLVTARITQLTT
jgi:hypothetical protein